jgi:hypothetical protein
LLATVRYWDISKWTYTIVYIEEEDFTSVRHGALKPFYASICSENQTPSSKGT